MYHSVRLCASLSPHTVDQTAVTNATDPFNPAGHAAEKTRSFNAAV
jgi:hypothetical protein